MRILDGKHTDLFSTQYKNDLFLVWINIFRDMLSMNGILYIKWVLLAEFLFFRKFFELHSMQQATRFV